ncbi:P-glycoprotein 11 [Perilla frutescens var. hirtella]|uniref:p-glycoprotein 11 n=1 Tax=Perilla frutescens var. hirtella TaxID=608512 RepID=A0AAD4P5Y9_PERFH|nr:P-glycoprotein 11 [Perilla frutescens var. hirtella]
MALGTIAAIGNGLSQPLMALIFGELIDVFGKSQTKDMSSLASKVSLKFVYLALGCGVTAFLQVSCWTITGERQSARIRSLYLKAILRQDIAYFDQEVSTGEVIGRMSGDIVLIQDAIGEKVTSAFVGGFVTAFVKGWLLTLVLLSAIPLMIASAAVLFTLKYKIDSLAQKANADASNVVQQTIDCIRTVASFRGEKQAVANYDKFLASTYKSDTGAGLCAGLGLGITMFNLLCSYGMAVWFGGKMILQKGYTGGDVFTVLLSVMIGSMSLGQAWPPMTAFAAGQAAAFKMFETMNRKPSIDAYDERGEILNDIRGDIELKDVSFSYPARPKELIFDAFSVFIPNGTTAALVGQSGSGKSTVVSLIERFYDPVGGQVLIDGLDLREFQLKWIRSKIGLVSQEPVLFTASIKDNIAYGKDGASLEEIRAAAALANVKDFIDKLPQGMDTMVGERGIQLSGGQKQRVAIARAIIKDPRILLLDEATSALDADSERIVQGALEKIMMNRTTVVVAHRLSTIRNANMIAVLHKGKIVEKGTHFELLKDPEGVYSNLIYSQEGNDESDMADNIIKSSVRMSSSCSLSSRSLGVGSSSSQSLSPSFSKTTADDDKIDAFSPKTSKVSIYRLARLNKPEIPVLIAGATVGIITGAILPVFGLLTSYMIKTFYELPHKLKEDSEFWALMFVTLGVVSLIVYPTRAHLFSVAGNKLIQRIRIMCFEKMVRMEIGWFDTSENSSGVISARLSTDATMIRALVGDALAQLVQEASSVVVGMVIAFEACWQLALMVLVMMPLLGLNNYVQMKYGEDTTMNAKLMYEKASQVANDGVSNIRTVASFCAQEKVVEIYMNKCEGAAARRRKLGLIGGIGFGASILSMYLVYAATFYAGARLIQERKTTTSHMFRVFFALSMVATAISTWSAMAPDSTKAKSAAASIFTILDRKSKIDPSDESGMTLGNVKGEIEFRHVNFSYPTRSHIQILKDLSLTVSSGKVVALVGESGSGKSTVISLLQRFYDPDSGMITLDGIEIQKLQLKWLRQQMGLVSQEPILFNDTIKANIAYGIGGSSATEAEIIDAAKSANAHEFISGLNQGYDTIVGERGVQLSGGQKQRVAIARAIIKSPTILLLDEATSALDAESEKIVQEALDKVMVNRTTIVVAHRLSTIRGADFIAVFRNGRILEKGNHTTLTNLKDGYYSSLVTALHMTSA